MYEAILSFCNNVKNQYKINWEIECFSERYLVRFFCGKKNKSWGIVCDDFTDMFQNAYFYKSQPKRTTFFIPRY